MHAASVWKDLLVRLFGHRRRAVGKKWPNLQLLKSLQNTPVTLREARIGAMEACQGLSPQVCVQSIFRSRVAAVHESPNLASSHPASTHERDYCCSFF